MSAPWSVVVTSLPEAATAAREALLLAQVASGNIVHSWATITASNSTHSIELGVSEDALRVGTPGDCVRITVNAETAQHIADALIAVDPAHATEYRANQAAYIRKLDQLRGELSERVARVADRRFIAHHPAWPYFARRFGFQIVGTIQPQSGSEPSALQLHGLIATIKKDRIKVVVSEVQLSRRIPELLAKETGARVVVLTTLPGGLPHTDTFLDMLRYNVLQLAQALEGL